MARGWLKVIRAKSLKAELDIKPFRSINQVLMRTNMTFSHSPRRLLHVQLYTLCLLTICALLTACGGGNGSPQTPIPTKAITAFSIRGVAGSINETAKTISVTLPNSTNPALLRMMVANFTTNGTSVSVGAVPQISGVTTNDFSAVVLYSVTASDGSVTSYMVQVRIAASADKTISDFVLNGVSGSVDEVHKTIGVVMPAGYPLTSLTATFLTSGNSVFIGNIQQASGSGIGGTVNNFSAGPVVYTVNAADGTFVNYTVYVRNAPPTDKLITEFVLNGIYGVIDEVNRAISVTLPSGTNTTQLVADFSTGAAGIPASGIPAVAVSGIPQTSQSTPNNFTNPLVYVVTPASGTPASYTVTATVAPANAKALTHFALNNIPGTINVITNTIAVKMPFAYPLTSLVATYLTTGTAVSIGATPQTTGITSNDYTLPVVYTVAAANGTTANYTVTVSNGLNTDSKITQFSLNGVPGVITDPLGTQNGRITVTTPRGTNLDLSSVTAHYVASGSRVHIAGTTQISGFTNNALVTSKPLTYTVDSALGQTNFSLYDLSHYESTCDVAAQPPYLVQGNYRLYNNPWGRGTILSSQFTECMYWNPTPAALAKWTWNWPFTANSNGVFTQSLRAYPSIQYRPGDSIPNIPLNTVSATTKLAHGVTVVDTTSAATNLLAPQTVPPTLNPAGSVGDYNVAYDIWIDSPTTRNTNCYKAELMIKLAGTWEDKPLFMNPANPLLPLQLTVTDPVNNTPYIFNVSANTMNIGTCSWHFYSFMGYSVAPTAPLNNPPTLLSGASLPLQPFITYLINNAAAITTAAKATMNPAGSILKTQIDATPTAITDVITGLEFGTEIVQGAGDITVNSFSVTP